MPHWCQPGSRPTHGRVWLFWKWRYVVDQLRAFFVHGRDVPALGTAVHTLDSSRPWSWLGGTPSAIGDPALTAHLIVPRDGVIAD